jgi:hypothetical protein
VSINNTKTQNPLRYYRLSDFRTIVVSGTTSSSTDTAATFGHNATEVPTWWIVQEGDVYIPRYGMGSDTVIVQSRLASQAFRLLLFFS